MTNLGEPFIKDSVSFSTFHEKEYFKYEDYWERWDPNKQYTKGEFVADYGNGEHKYEYRLVTLINTDTINGLHYILVEDKPTLGFTWHRDTLSFVIAHRIFEKEELDLYLPYCQCNYHKSQRNPSSWANWWNIDATLGKNFLADDCVEVGRLEGVKKAQKYMSKNSIVY